MVNDSVKVLEVLCARTISETVEVKQRVTMITPSKILNPKSEIRDNFEIRNSKFELVSIFDIRHSDFIFVIIDFMFFSFLLAPFSYRALTVTSVIALLYGLTEAVRVVVAV